MVYHQFREVLRMATEQESLQIEIIVQRLASVEKEVAQLKQQAQQLTTAETEPWYLKQAGRFANDPDFEEIVRLGREMRKADCPD
jgi:hypothetical protein